MSIENVFDNIKPWTYVYAPYQSQNDNHEIACYQVFDAADHKVCDTNEDRPGDEQERYARAIAAIPEALRALRLAELALNTAPMFGVSKDPRFNSYEVVSLVSRAIKQLGNI